MRRTLESLAVWGGCIAFGVAVWALAIVTIWKGWQ